MSSYTDYAVFIETLLRPWNLLKDNVLRPPYDTFTRGVIDFYFRYLLDTRPGHIFVKTVLSPASVYAMNRWFDCRALMQVFNYMPPIARQGLAAGTSLLNQPMINDPLTLMIADISIVYCGVMYGQPSRREAYRFFFFLQTMNGSDIVGHEMGTGMTSDPRNIYFPEAMSLGPVKRVEEKKARIEEKKSAEGRFLSGDNQSLEYDVNDADVPFLSREKSRMQAVINGKTDNESDCESTSFRSDGTEKPPLHDRRLQIALTCLLYSVMTYSKMSDIEFARKRGFVVGTRVFELNTGQSGTSMNAFINAPQRYAVLAFRGTQFEVLRQMLTSLDFRLEHFETFDTNHHQTKARTIYSLEVNRSTKLFKFSEPFAFADERTPVYLTPLELVRYLNQLNYKVYITGHSLGGGLAQLFAADLLANGYKIDGLVTFGATPVGDEKFVQWFDEKLAKERVASWRFVYNKEFAPLVPPIPFIQRSTDVQLRHIENQIHFAPKAPQTPQNSVEVEAMLKEMSLDTGIVQTLADHNPMLTRKALQSFLYSEEILNLPMGTGKDQEKPMLLQKTV
eukprot:augustus_masked-scaffold_2-processed-gene-14.50-mRNA-1 protein AED:0.30 eAED:0.30 QI:0/-1/0/1/-1/1/1/0/563